MALSGRIDGSVSNLSTYFSFYAEWTATQSIADNASYLNVSTYWATTNLLRTFDTSSSRTATITINGTTDSISKRFKCNPWDSSGIYLIQTVESFRIDHNADGTPPTVTISATADGTASTYGPSASSLSGSITLDTIPRYATITQTLASKTETTATIRWATDATVDKLWYSSNNGSSWTAVSIADSNSGTYTISGLTANTSYNVKTRVRRKDSQLTSDSTALSVKTYSYPYASSMPDFTIGDRLTLGFYNPLGREFTFYIIANGSQISNNWTISGTSYSGVNASSSKTQLYATIPNVQSATYQVKCVYGSSTIIKTGGTMSINASECYPSVGTVSYRDVNSSVTAITGDDQLIVRNKSTVRYTASSLSAKNSATVSSVKVSVNGTEYSLTISGTSATGGNASIDSGSDLAVTFSVTDSRGLITTKNLTVTMADWSVPSAIISMSRVSNYYSETNITVDADYSYVGGHNSITITYKAKKQGTSTWTVTGTLSDNVQSQFTADNQYKWDVQVTLVDAFGGTTTYNLSLNRGLPLIFFDVEKNSVGVNGFPANDDSFEVLGLSVLSDNILPADTLSNASVILPSQSGHIVRLNYNGAVTATIPVDLPIGYECLITNIYQGARVTIVASGSETISVVGATATVSSVTVPYSYSYLHLIKVTATRWYVDVNKNDFYTAGDVITGADVRVGVGFVTTSSTDLAVYLPLGKPILGATGATLNTFACNLRHASGGYLQYYDGTTRTTLNTTTGDWVTNELYDSVTAVVVTGGLYLTFKCNSKWNLANATVTNNSLVCVQFGTLSITLS